MRGQVKNVFRGLAILTVAGLLFGLARPDLGNGPAFGGGKKTEKDKKDPPKIPEKKKEVPKDKTKPLAELKGHKDWINSVSFSADGKYLITASRDKTIKIWDLKAGKEVNTLKGIKTNVKIALFTLDGKQAVTTTGGWDKKKKAWEGEIKIWDIEKGKEAKTLKGHSAEIETAALSPKGDLLVTGSEDTTAIIWSLKDGKALQTLKGSKTKINSVAFNSDGTKVVTGSSLPIPKDPVKPKDPKGKEPKETKPTEEIMVKVWNVADGKELQSFKGPERDVSSVAFSPDGKYLAAGSWDGKVYLWDLTGKLIKKLEAQEGVLSIDFSHNGKYIAASGWEDTTKVWDVESAKELFYRNGHSKSVTGVLFSPDNQQLITIGVDQTVKIWEVPGGKK